MDKKKMASLLAAFLLGILVASFWPWMCHETRYVSFGENKILDVSTGRVYVQSANKTWRLSEVVPSVVGGQKEDMATPA